MNFKEISFWVIGIATLIYCLVELAVGLAESSLTLLSDGFHNLSDVISLYIAYYASKASRRGRSDTMSYGWKRTEILGALTNGIFLVSLAVYITLETIPELIQPEDPPTGWVVIIIAGFGLAINTIATLVFHFTGQSHGHSHAGGGHGHSHGGSHGHAHGEDEDHGHSHSEKKKKKEGHGHSHEEKIWLVDDYNMNSSLSINDDDGHGHSHSDKKKKKEGHGHSHDEGDHGHSHSDKKKKEGHGHSHDEGDHGHSHSDKKKKEGHGHSHSGDDHGHSHSNKDVHSLEDGHGHSHSSKKANNDDHGHSHTEKPKKIVDANVKAVCLHYFGDMVSSFFVLLMGLVIYFTDSTPPPHWVDYIDPITSLLIVVLILVTTLPLIKGCFLILLQRTPQHIDLQSLKSKIISLSGVLNVHDFHVWQLVDGMIITSLHINVEESIDFNKISKKIKKLLHKAGIHSSAIQPEFVHAHHQDSSSCLQNCVEDCAEDWCCKEEKPKKNNKKTPLKQSTGANKMTYSQIEPL